MITNTLSEGIYEFLWESEQVKINVSRLRNNDGELSGEINISTTAPGVPPHLHLATLNFMASRTRQSLSKQLNERYQIAWDDILEQLCVKTIQLYRQGTPVHHISVDDATDVPRPSWLLEPVLARDEPTLFFGDGGVGKSYIALLFATIISRNIIGNEMGLIPCHAEGDSKTVLWLDWETDRNQMMWRLNCLRKGMGLPNANIHYRRCYIPLAQDIEKIREILTEINPAFVIIDSVGMAAGGDLNSNEIAIQFMNAVRIIGITTMLITHTSKNELTKTKTAFGSVYFHNAPRATWEVRRAQEAGENVISVGLFHRKHNNSKRFDPIGMKLSFGDDAVSITRNEIENVVDFVDQLNDKDKIRIYLQENVTAKVADISKAIGIKDNQVRARLNESPTIFRKEGELWTLVD